MKKLTFDTIIIGAGPAGLSSAINLYNNGIKNICIIEKQTINYHKPCAGLLTKKSYDLMKDMKIDVEKEVDYLKSGNISVFYKDKFSVRLTTTSDYNYHGLFSLNATRVNLDLFLRNKVKELKIKVFYETKIDHIDLEKQEVIGNDTTFHYNNLIFADGQNGYSKRFHPKDKKQNFSLEVAIPDKDQKEPFVHMYFGISKKGYAWVGSTGKYLNIGLTDEYNKKEDYIVMLKKFAKDNGYDLNKRDIKGAFIPTKPKQITILKNNVYFVGDSAGLVDPITVEGIYYSFVTGKYAAEAIKRNDINYYQNKIKPIKDNFNYMNHYKSLFFNKWVQKFIWGKFAEKHAGFISYAWTKVIIEGKYSYKEVLKCHKEYKDNKKNQKV